MGLIKNIKNFVFGSAKQSISRSNYVYMANVIQGQITSVFGHIEKGYQMNADVYSIVSFIAGKVATVPFDLYEVKDEKQLMRYKAMTTGAHSQEAKVLKMKALKAVDSDHPIVKMLNKAPNSHMNASEFKFGFALYRLVTGNSYIRGFAPESEPTKFVEMHLMPSHLINPIGAGIYDAARAYRLTWDPEEILAEQMSHSRYFNPDFEWPSNPFVIGQSPLQAAANIVLRSNSGMEASTKAFQNGGMAGILYQDGGSDLSEAQRKLLQDHIDKKITGAGNYKQILAASSKMGWLKIGESPIDLGILESMSFDMRALCNIFHVNSAIFNDPENKAYNNVSEARKAAITDAVLPELTALRDAINQWLVPGWEKADGKKYFADYDASVFPEMQASMKESAEWLNVAWWLSPNQKLVQMDYEPQGEEFDQIFVPMGMAPIGSGSSEADIDFNKAFKATGDIDYSE